jgi:hypothetical protein
MPREKHMAEAARREKQDRRRLKREARRDNKIPPDHPRRVDGRASY